MAEARYLIEPGNEYPETAFMVDEEYQGRGIATYLVNYMTEIAKERGIEGFQADVLLSNLPMIKVFERTASVLHRKVEDGVGNSEVVFRGIEISTGRESVRLMPWDGV